MGRIGNRISRLVNSKTEKDEQNQSSDNDLSPEKEPPKRVKPRLGSQYQTKVAKFEHSQSDEVTKRQLPDLMSMDYPHITEHEAQRSGEDLNDWPILTIPFRSGYETKRGGLCVHKTFSKRDDFLTQAQHIIQPDLAKQPHYHANEGWKQEMIRLNATGVRRGRNKRLLSEHQKDDSWTATPSTTTTSFQVSNEGLVLEDQECILEYLQLRYQGNVEHAELSVRVHLQSGTASKARRCVRKVLHNSRNKRPSSESSQSWRCRWERVFSNILGDCREDATFTAYPHIETKTDDHMKEQIECLLMEDDNDDMRGVWRSVLSCGQDIERALNGDGERLYMRKVIDFLRNAFALPTPETYFGNRHLVVQGISACFNSIFDHLSKARDFQAKVHDFLFDEQDDGVDMEALKKIIDEGSQRCRIHIEDIDVVKHQIGAISRWQVKLDAILTLDDNSMDVDSIDNFNAAHVLSKEAQMLGIRTRNLVLLEKRMSKAKELQQRLKGWRESQSSGRKETIKFLSCLVRDANRISLPSKEVRELLHFNREFEVWTDRVNVAIRSRISLSEIKLLMKLADSFPLDLSDSLEKLNLRVHMAREWLDLLELEVPCPLKDGVVDNIEWMTQMRIALKDDTKNGCFARLHELASVGTRVSVEIEAVKMLKVELEAKNWSARARKWLPHEGRSNDDESLNKKGKLEDLREHLQKARILREKLVINEKKDWILDGESELYAIVIAANKWLDEYLVYLECDNRRNEVRSCLSIDTLKGIVMEGKSIHANIGTGIIKMSRVLAQASAWHQKYLSVLARTGQSQPNDIPPGHVSIVEMNEAVSAATKEISLDLKEALAIRDLAKRAQQWMDKVILAAPKRTKRKEVKNRFTVEDLLYLIEEAKTLPIPTEVYIDRLKSQLNQVFSWRKKAQEELKGIALGFDLLRSGINGVYGEPEDFFRDGMNLLDHDGDISMSVLCNDVLLGTNVASLDSGVSSPSENTSRAETESQLSQNDVSVEASDELLVSLKVGGNKENVFKLVEKLQGDARQTGIFTIEEEVANQLETIAKWCAKSLKFLTAPNLLCEKKNFSLFDKFVTSGNELFTQRDVLRTKFDDDELNQTLVSSWSTLMNNQLIRLSNLHHFREKFISWSKQAHQMLSGKEKRPSVGALGDLAMRSQVFPSNSNMVQKVRTLSESANKWSFMASTRLNADQKMTMQEAKELFDQGEKLKINSDELKVLRSALRSARGWLNRVKRSKFDQGETSSSDVEDLIDEHDSLDLALPEEVQKLKQAMKGYCICRRPYEGFMIGCDGCEEWYHGSCIGISEAQAERCDKYVCVRCSIQKTFLGSANAVASVLRKWTCIKELKKSRQNEYQKHQRKIRKERKDIEKLECELDGFGNIVFSRDQCDQANALNAMQFSCPDQIPTESRIFPERCLCTQMNGAHLSEIDIVDILDSKRQIPLVSKKGYVVTTSQRPLDVTSGHELPMCIHASMKTVLLTSLADEYATKALVRSVKKAERSKVSQGDLVQEKNEEVSTNEYSLFGESGQRIDMITSPESADEREDQMEKVRLAINMGHERLKRLSRQAQERNDLERVEDSCQDVMFRWCVRIRSIILVPSSMALAEISCPSIEGNLSTAMLNSFLEAEQLGISEIPDVHVIVNSFRCLAWCSLAMQTLARKPSLADVSRVVAQCSSLSLPDEKAVRMLKAMVQRSLQWQLRARKVLATSIGETKPLSIEALRTLQDAESDVPLDVPEMQCLAYSILDKGKRHCLCGGLNDGTFMLGCDKCGRWFHGRCVGVPKHIGRQLEKWLCISCDGRPVDTSGTEASIRSSLEVIGDDDTASCSTNNEMIPHAPVVATLWPPFGLLHSPESILALGQDCCGIPDDIGPLLLRSQGFNDLDVTRNPSNVPMPVITFPNTSPTSGVRAEEEYGAFSTIQNLVTNKSSSKKSIRDHLNNFLLVFPDSSAAQPHATQGTIEMTQLNSPELSASGSTKIKNSLRNKSIIDTLGFPKTAKGKLVEGTDDDVHQQQHEGEKLDDQEHSLRYFESPYPVQAHLIGTGTDMTVTVPRNISSCNFNEMETHDHDEKLYKPKVGQNISLKKISPEEISPCDTDLPPLIGSKMEIDTHNTKQISDDIPAYTPSIEDVAITALDMSIHSDESNTAAFIEPGSALSTGRSAISDSFSLEIVRLDGIERIIEATVSFPLSTTSEL